MAGISIIDPNRTIQILKQGGSGYHLLREGSEKIALHLKAEGTEPGAKSRGQGARSVE